MIGGPGWRFIFLVNVPLGILNVLLTDGALDGLKLIGFAVWERRSGSGRNVTFPARQYVVNGDRRSFALLRPVAGREPRTQGVARRLCDDTKQDAGLERC